MTKIVDLSGKGAAISGAENDANLSSLSGINQSITTTTHTIDVNDQNDTLEYSNASPIAVTLPSIASVTGANLHTDDFKVTLKNIGAGFVTVTRSSTDTFEDASTAITLNKYESATIQTDSTLGKWNIISSKLTAPIMTTAVGGALAADGANTWAELSAINLGATTESIALELELNGVLFGAATVGSGARILVKVSQSNTAITVTDSKIDVLEIHDNSYGLLSPSSFKLVSSSTASGTVIYLWVEKFNTYGLWSVRELSKTTYVGAATVTYNDNAPWQAAAPVGAGINIVSTLATVEAKTTASVLADTATTNANLTGDVTSIGNNTTLSSSTFANKLVAVQFGTLGSRALMLCNDYGTYNPGDFISGSLLQYSSAAGPGGGSTGTVTGTWQCMGYSINSSNIGTRITTWRKVTV